MFFFLVLVFFCSPPVREGSLHVERTLKYFQGVAGKKFILSIQWAIDCVKKSTLLDEVHAVLCLTLNIVSRTMVFHLVGTLQLNDHDFGQFQCKTFKTV